MTTESKKAEAAEGKTEDAAVIQKIQQRDPAEQAERLQKLLSGRVKAPSEIVAFMIDEARKVFQELDHVNKQLQGHREAARQAENRALELNGVRKKYLDDIQVWDRKALEKTEESPKPDNGESP